MKNWDDIRIFLAVARAGSITAGAKILGLDQSTVSRRLQTIEEKIGQNLFIGTAKRNTLSLTGQKYYDGALRLEKEVEQINQTISAHNNEETGTIHVVTTDILSNHLILSITSEFLKQHPKINLRIHTQSIDPNMKKGDVALFATNNPKEDLFGRKLATATFAAYASQSYYERYKNDQNSMVWLNWDDGADNPTWPALAQNIPDEMCRLRCDSVSSLLEAVRMGIGATILPCFIGESDPTLARINPDKIVSSRDIWLLVHADLRQVPRIRTFLDFFAEHIKSQKHIIESN
ncbi:LysR family transcriptional regulator [Pseudemcibacter aquimaris]|uniref:LysR family transcriptional regulator n=1 Tax=Pseudemcibacter aquimaris TaxID=2857064 RepID=UPI00201164D9|nr:LysR family transcriptional regulator [Pseudemcibacter aquimaris]MCC3861480.1 LysR family transcriptional regulator [Pseudemcibacter aquimaris]WDU58249.1 LysR family transcriptional regulator [Pseudemcibacter aquimaris]